MDDPERPLPTGSRPAAAEAYLNELARALEGVDRVERDDVLTSMREHIDEDLAMLGHAPTPSEVNALLGRLGSVDEVLATLESDAPEPQLRDTQARPTAWLAVTAVVAGALSLLLLIIPFVPLPFALAAVIIGIRGIRRRDEHRPLYILAVVLGIFGLFVGLLPALPLLWMSTGPAGPAHLVSTSAPAVSISP